MEVPAKLREVVRFGEFELRLSSAELTKYGLKIRLQEQPFQILVMLLERPGQVVTREELRARLWPDDKTFVDFEVGLNSAVLRLRNALSDTADNPRFVETIPRRGYRFIGVIEEAEAVSDWRARSPEPAVEQHPQNPSVESLGEPGSVSLTHPVRRRIWIAVGAAVALLAIVLSMTFRGRWKGLASSPAPQRIQSIAVLPLENLTGDATQDYFAEGMTEELTTDLAKISALRVISRTSAMQYKGTKKSLPQIARELNVEAVIEGSVERSGDRVRIIAQLLDAPNDKHLWADSFERDMRDALALQDDVARAIALEIKAKLTPQEKTRLAGARPVDPEAQDAVFRGRYEIDKRTVEGLKKALEFFQQAIQRDPQYADAWAGLADTYNQSAYLGIAPQIETFARAKAAALKALELDESCSEAHRALASSILRVDMSPPGALRELERALALDPNNAEAHQYYSRHLAAAGRFDEAIAEGKRSVLLDPLTPHHHNSLGVILYFAGYYDEALEEFHKMPDPTANSARRHRYMAEIYERKGMLKEAMPEWLSSLKFESDTELAAKVERTYQSSGYAEAKKTLLAGEARSAQEGKNHSFPERNATEVAADYALLGDKEKALEWLQKDLQEQGGEIWGIKTNPDFETLHSDPRFQKLLRTLGLSP
jgi:TolB-like protein/DNA-binding winged helix-turn-helix (wHTH) protein